MKKNRLSRKDFLHISAGLTGSMLIPSFGFAGDEQEKKESIGLKKGYIPDVSLAWIKKGEHKNSYELFKKLIESATDFKWLSKGDRVFLKLALNSGNQYPATTDSWALSCMIKLLKEKGAGEVLAGDQSGVESVLWTRKNKKGSSRENCKSAGLLKTIKESGAKEVFFEEAGYDSYLITTPEGPSHWEKPIMISNIVKKVDHIIYMPRVASHLMGDITSGLKLAVGFLRDDSRLYFHQGGDKFNEMYEEINEVPQLKNKVRLIMSSGRKVLSNFGPDYGHVSEPDTGLIFASTDLLAHEITAYSWLLWNREKETSYLSNATTGSVTNLRNIANKMFVWWMWDDDAQKAAETPDIPMFEAGRIKDHPAIINRMKRIGGSPELIAFNEINGDRKDEVYKFIDKSSNL